MPFSLEIKAEALIACGRRCCICHKACGVRMECHHIVPEAKGGPDALANCIPLCFDCHAEVEHYNAAHPKGNKFTPEELRGHRENWHRLLREAVMSAMEKGEIAPEEMPAITVPPPLELTEREVKVLQDIVSSGGETNVHVWHVVPGESKRTEFDLGELKEKGMAEKCPAFGGGDIYAGWQATQAGKRYLVQHGLFD